MLFAPVACVPSITVPEPSRHATTSPAAETAIRRLDSRSLPQVAICHCAGGGSRGQALRLVACGTYSANRPGIGGTDGQDASADRLGVSAGPVPQSAGERWLIVERGAGSAFGRIKTDGSRPPIPEAADVTPTTQGARQPSCGLRPRGGRQGRHYEAWRASLTCCGRLSPCPASCRRLRRAKRSRRGAGR